MQPKWATAISRFKTKCSWLFHNKITLTSWCNSRTIVDKWKHQPVHSTWIIILHSLWFRERIPLRIGPIKLGEQARLSIYTRGRNRTLTFPNHHISHQSVSQTNLNREAIQVKVKDPKKFAFKWEVVIIICRIDCLSSSHDKLQCSRIKMRSRMRKSTKFIRILPSRNLK